MHERFIAANGANGMSDPPSSRLRRGKHRCVKVAVATESTWATSEFQCVFLNPAL
jgi:hypothetical protein